jgi:hypothetical protein
VSQRAERTRRTEVCHICHKAMATGEVGVRTYANWCHLRCHGELPDDAIAAIEWAKRQDARKEAHVKGPRGHLPIE